MMPTLPDLARAYGVNVIDWASDVDTSKTLGTGILFVSGDGLMLATMDALFPVVRWVVSIEHLLDVPTNLASFAEAVELIAKPVVIAGWFQMDPLEPVAELVKCFSDPIVYTEPQQIGEPSWSAMVETVLGACAS